MMRGKAQILQSRGHERTPLPGEAEYEGLVENVGGFTMAFSIHPVNGPTRAYYFHDVHGPAHDIREENGETYDFVSFQHLGEIVTMRGQNLMPVFNALKRNCADELHEHDGIKSYSRSKPFIDRVFMTKLNYPDELN